MSEPDCRVRAREWINRVPPSAERNERPLSSGSSRRAAAPPVDAAANLPALPDLLDDVDFSALEDFTQTLLEDFARDLDGAAPKASDQVSVPCSDPQPPPLPPSQPNVSPSQFTLLDLLAGVLSGLVLRLWPAGNSVLTSALNSVARSEIRAGIAAALNRTPLFPLVCS